MVGRIINFNWSFFNRCGSMKTVISLGGSLIYPDNIDYEYLKKFVDVIESYDSKFAIICGGGKLARELQDNASNISDAKKDLLGIEATKQNATVVKSLFTDVYDRVVQDPTEKVETEKKVVVYSGWKPGWSTDYDAVLIAEDKVINMSNVDYVHDSDPKKNPDAKPLHEISWENFKKLVGDKWKPGLSMPFDPIAAKEAHQRKIKVLIIGPDLVNLKNVLDGKDFNGTIIS